MTRTAEPMATWTIFDRPLDHPQGLIARKFLVRAGVVEPTQETLIAPSLEELRDLLPFGLACFPRDPADPESVVETWL